MRNFTLIAILVLVSSTFFGNQVAILDVPYNDSLFIDPLKPNYIGREIEVDIALWPEWRARHLIIP